MKRAQARKGIEALIVGCTCALMCTAAGLAQARPGELPTEYQDILAQALTDFAPDDSTADAGGAPGVVLLDEHVVLVREDGSTVEAIHRVLVPVTGRGVERAERIVQPYLSQSETISVAMGRRIGPGGDVSELRPDAAFVQTPSVLRDTDHYSELAELVLLFPGTRPGDVVEYVIVKQSGAMIPGEYTQFLALADLWPVREFRREVIASPELIADLQAVPIGIDLPQEGPLAREDGRSSVRWSLQDGEALRLEQGRAPIRQTGPGIWVSTLENWEELACWYADLTEGFAELDQGLARSVADWTRGARTFDERLRTLYDVVANQVDYMAIEFGRARIEPRSASEVWQARYGDCKDQVQLLRAMLRQVGIASYPAFVNTRHAGKIDTRVPDYRQFDHVILAVERPDGEGYLFCDPTEPHARPGELPPCCRGRTALVLAGKRAELVDIPRADPEGLLLRFQLELDAYGAADGWLHVTARGHQGRMLIDQLTSQDQTEGHEAAKAFLELFYHDVQVLDQMSEETTDGAMLGVGFKARVDTEWRGLVLRVPAAPLLFPALGGQGTRETAFYHPCGQVAVEVMYTLPEGWAPREEPPGLLARKGEFAAADASWTVDGTRAVGRFEYETSTCVVEPDDFAGYRRTFERLQGWLESPLRIAQSDAEAVAAGSSSNSVAPRPVELPRLPSGQAQLRLVDVLYPRDGNLARRREALALVSDWFHDDPPTALQAGLEIVVIDQVAGYNERSIMEIDTLVAAYGDEVDRKLTAWSEYLMADGLKAIGRVSQARNIYDRLAHETGLSVHRRGWAFLEAARLREGARSLEAIDVLDEAVRLDSPALPDQVVLLVRLLLQGAPAEVVHQRLDRVCDQHPHRLVLLHEHLVDEAAALLGQGRLELAKKMSMLLQERVSRESQLADLSERLACMDRAIGQSMVCQKVAADIDDYFSRCTPDWWSEAEIPDQAMQRDRLVLLLQDLDRRGEVHRFVRGTVELSRRWTVAPDFFGFLLWRCGQHLEDMEADAELAMKFREWCGELPEANRFAQKD